MPIPTPIVSKLRYSYRRMTPTLKHRPILTLGILGTVYGVSPEGEVKYFDYDWEGALEFAGITDENLEGLDVRFGKPKRAVYLPGHDMWHPERMIGTSHYAYWALKEAS